MGCPDHYGCLKAEGHSQEESRKTHAQGPKSAKSVLVNETNKNEDEQQLRDLSASDGGPCKPAGKPDKRRRSSHSSSDPKNPKFQETKGNSAKPRAERQGSRSMITNQILRTFVQSRLTELVGRDGMYSGIIRILANPEFLQFCYMLIKKKPGNMSKGITRETLDGIDFA